MSNPPVAREGETACEFFLIVNLGPVQDFIASARRSRDLWFGSYLLSELSKTAAREIVQREGRPQEQVLVFPAPQHDSDLTFGSSHLVNRTMLWQEVDVAALLNGIPHRHSPLPAGNTIADALLHRFRRSRQPLRIGSGAIARFREL